MHVKYYEINPRTIKEKIIYYGSSAEYILMLILTTAIFWIKYFNQNEVEFSILQMHGYIFIQLFVIIFVIYISFSYMSYQRIKYTLALKWDKVKENEGQDL